ncbi:hypothetical protein V22_23100 [Calycomorphotria hydatis]|uniref:Uncharacterized protein n=1 Tax=Calycomorphotria hydatis TaxID=2528027 RepID=A0A517T9L0_9PLAN|nr:hypothetical protein V22_23100 [Calycomorphotria hydatis]
MKIQGDLWQVPFFVVLGLPEQFSRTLPVWTFDFPATKAARATFFARRRDIG